MLEKVEIIITSLCIVPIDQIIVLYLINMYKHYMFIKIKIPFMLISIKITLLSNLKFLKIGNRMED